MDISVVGLEGQDGFLCPILCDAIDRDYILTACVMSADSGNVKGEPLNVCQRGVAIINALLLDGRCQRCDICCFAANRGANHKEPGGIAGFPKQVLYLHDHQMAAGR